MLKIDNLNVYYGVIHAINDVSIEVPDGQIVTLIGANGAGKTTILHTITGLKKATSGSILWNDKELTKEHDYKIVNYKMAHVPEGRHVFANMSVQENLEMGAAFTAEKSDTAELIEGVYKRFPRLRERAKQFAGTLSGGEQQMLAVGRALMSRPKILLMDEPSMGLSPILVQEIFKIIKELHEQGLTILLVEQNARMALSIADQGYVLENGRIKMHDKAGELLRNDEVRKAYLGV